MSDTVNQSERIAKRPTDKLRELLDDPQVADQFKRAMAEHASTFMASIVELVATDSGLQECPPSAVLKEALKAATLDIPLNRALGFAYILPFNVKQGDKWQKMPQFIPGYKLYIQLALRTKEYRYINADVVYEGQQVERDSLTGKIDIIGAPTSETVQGYVAYFELLSGFRKAKYMTKAEVLKHAEKYSKSYGNAGGPWKQEFDAMALKTVLKGLLSKYGPLSIQSPLTDLMAQDEQDELQEEISREANQEQIAAPKEPEAPKAPF